MVSISKLIQRSWFYFQKGYGTYLALPIGLMSIATSAYFLAVQNIPQLTKIFPNFYNFVIVFPLIYPVAVTIGWIHYRKTNIYQQEQEVVIHSSPYTTVKIPPISLPTWILFSTLARKEGLDDVADQMDDIIRRSRV